MNDVIIKLISQVYEKDEFGVQQSTESAAEVFAKVQSITSSEFYNAGNSDLRPVYKFSDIYTVEYNNEKTVEYEGERYSVYRTYQPYPDKIELYVERKVGNSVKQNKN